jgi:gluconokinase
LAAFLFWRASILQRGKANQIKMVVIIMGVAGSGKTTIGSLLADELGWDFYDADDFHTEASRTKMSQGIPLTDDDRAVWLASLRELICKNIQSQKASVLACSALKQSYRATLKVNRDVEFVYLKGSFQQIKTRLMRRTGHYMPPKLLASQFDILEEPADALKVDISHTPQEIIKSIRKGLNL